MPVVNATAARLPSTSELTRCLPSPPALPVALRSGFETSFAARDVCYWRSRDVSMVVKTHALHKDFMVGAQCTDGTFLPGFDLAVTSFRDPFETGCSLVKKDGRVAASTCEKILCEQHAFYHPPTVKLVADGHGDNEAAAVSRRPEMVYEMDFRDLTSGLRLDILRDLAEALGLTQSLARAGAALLNPESAAEGVSQGDALEAVLRAVARELKLLRPLGDPIHSLRSAQHPVSLMHANHVGRAGANAQALCDADAGLNAMRKNPVCHALAENHGRVSDALWDAYPSWQGRCARLKKIPTPLTKEELVAKTAAESQQKRQKQKQRQQQQQQQQKREL